MKGDVGGSFKKLMLFYIMNIIISVEHLLKTPDLCLFHDESDGGGGGGLTAILLQSCISERGGLYTGILLQSCIH